jgi:hypothetical protein
MVSVVSSRDTSFKSFDISIGLFIDTPEQMEAIYNDVEVLINTYAVCSNDMIELLSELKEKLKK